MVNAIVEHKWEEKDEEKIFNIVGSLVEMNKEKKFPEGFKLKSINVIGNERRAICNWDAPKVSDLQELVKSLSPPSDFKVFEAMKIL